MGKDEIRQREKEKQMPATLAKSPAGPIEQVANLKKRQQAVYWRPHTTPDGETIWIQTRPLPADTLSKEQYMNKGFRLKPPNDEQPQEVAVDAENEVLRQRIAQLEAQLTAKPPRKPRRAK